MYICMYVCMYDNNEKELHEKEENKFLSKLKYKLHQFKLILRPNFINKPIGPSKNEQHKESNKNQSNGQDL